MPRLSWDCAAVCSSRQVFTLDTLDSVTNDATSVLELLRGLKDGQGPTRQAVEKCKPFLRQVMKRREYFYKKDVGPRKVRAPELHTTTLSGGEALGLEFKDVSLLFEKKKQTVKPDAPENHEDVFVDAR